LRHALRHDALRTSVSNNFVPIRRNETTPLNYLYIVDSVGFELTLLHGAKVNDALARNLRHTNAQKFAAVSVLPLDLKNPHNFSVCSKLYN